MGSVAVSTSAADVRTTRIDRPGRHRTVLDRATLAARRAAGGRRSRCVRVRVISTVRLDSEAIDTMREMEVQAGVRNARERIVPRSLTGGAKEEVRTLIDQRSARWTGR